MMIPFPLRPAGAVGQIGSVLRIAAIPTILFFSPLAVTKFRQAEYAGIAVKNSP